MRPAGADADLNKVTHQGCLDAFAAAAIAQQQEFAAFRETPSEPIFQLSNVTSDKSIQPLLKSEWVNLDRFWRLVGVKGGRSPA
jgi:hypothetical protein